MLGPRSRRLTVAAAVLAAASTPAAADGGWLDPSSDMVLSQQSEAPLRDETVPDAPGGALSSSALRNLDGLSKAEIRAMTVRCRPILATSAEYEDNLVELCRLLLTRLPAKGGG